MLKDDHKKVEQLFKRYEKAGDRAYAEKRDVVERIIEALSTHAAVEEQVFYPVVRAVVDNAEDVALESLEEHHIVKWVLSELDGMSPEAERFDAKVTVLIENVRHHVEEEESDLFPKVRNEMGRSALSELGEVMAAARQVAPTHPHPRAPDTPPANLALGAVAGVADRIGDTVSGFAQGGMSAVNDIIATVLRRKKPTVSVHGSNGARKVAAEVRSRVSDITDAAVEAADKAKRTTKRAARTGRTTTSTAKAGVKRTKAAAKRGATTTARAARSGGRATATTARRSARKTASTARRSAARR